MYDNIEKLNSHYTIKPNMSQSYDQNTQQHTKYIPYSDFRALYFIYINLLAIWIWCSFCDMVKSLALNIIISCEVALPLEDFSLHYHSLQSP